MPPEAVEELVAAARTDAFSCIFLEGEEIYINCINEMTRQFIRDLSIQCPSSALRTTPGAGRSIRR